MIERDDRHIFFRFYLLSKYLNFVEKLSTFERNNNFGVVFRFCLSAIFI